MGLTHQGDRKLARILTSFHAGILGSRSVSL